MELRFDTMLHTIMGNENSDAGPIKSSRGPHMACGPQVRQQWRSQPKILGGAKMFDFRRITLFCLKKRLSKHKMTLFSKNLGGNMAPLPPLATPMFATPAFAWFILTNVHMMQRFLGDKVSVNHFKQKCDPWSVNHFKQKYDLWRKVLEYSYFFSDLVNFFVNLVNFAEKPVAALQ